MDQPWRIRMFGGLRAERGEQVVTRFRSQKLGVLLAYLAFYRDRVHPREVLTELLWPGAVPEAGRLNLRRELSYLRRLLEGPGVAAGSIVRADRFSVQLNPAAVATDAAKFEQAIEQAQATGSETERAQLLFESVDLYRGELLPGYYQDWIIREQRRADLCFQAVAWLTTHFAKSGELDRALDCARRAVAVDPLREESHAELIRLLVAAGKPSEAIRQYEDLERLLKEELDVAPSRAVRELANELKAQSAKAKPTLPAPAPPYPPASTRLPTGTVTFLLTELAGTEAPSQRNGDAHSSALARYHAILRRFCGEFGGREIKESAEALTVAFEHGSHAVACAIAIQRAWRATRGQEKPALCASGWLWIPAK